MTRQEALDAAAELLDRGRAIKNTHQSTAVPIKTLVELSDAYLRLADAIQATD